MLSYRKCLLQALMPSVLLFLTSLLLWVPTDGTQMIQVISSICGIEISEKAGQRTTKPGVYTPAAMRELTSIQMLLMNTKRSAKTISDHLFPDSKAKQKQDKEAAMIWSRVEMSVCACVC